MMAPLLLVLLAALPVFAGPWDEEFMQYSDYEESDPASSNGPEEEEYMQFRDYEDRSLIIGGVPTTIDEFPFVVSLIYLKKNRTIQHGCGGSIITKDWVLTAFHCTDPDHLLSRYQFQLINIRGGSSFTDRRGILRGIMETAAYENRSHDIALIKVDKPWPLNGVTISLARLPGQDDPIPVGSPATIMGWGDIDAKGTIPDILMKQEVLVISRSFCNASMWYWAKNEIDETKICTLFMPVKQASSTKYGDSGSPVVVNGEVVGIATFIHKKHYVAAPNVHTRVSSFIDWIEETVGPLPNTEG